MILFRHIWHSCICLEHISQTWCPHWNAIFLSCSMHIAHCVRVSYCSFKSASDVDSESATREIWNMLTIKTQVKLNLKHILQTDMFPKYHMHNIYVATSKIREVIYNEGTPYYNCHFHYILLTLNLYKKLSIKYFISIIELLFCCYTLILIAIFVTGSNIMGPVQYLYCHWSMMQYY